ncbi:hypothetical protein ACFL0D_01795 [Thermoproteota archaeon]
MRIPAQTRRRARKYRELNRRPTSKEFYRVIETAEELGLTRGFQRKQKQI